MRTKTLILTVVLALATAPLATASLPLSGPSLGTTPDDPVVEGEIGSESGRLEAGIEYYEDYSGCRFKSRCNDLQGIALRDHDITQAIADADKSKPVRFNLHDTGDYAGSQMASWKVCQHNQYDQLLGCIESGDYGLGGGVHSSTTSMRVILLTGLDRPYELVFWQSS